MSQQFGSFTASELYCPKCARSQPVREKLLLVVPSGEIYEFLCSGCGDSLGQRTVTGPPLAAALPPAQPAISQKRLKAKRAGAQPSKPQRLLR